VDRMSVLCVWGIVHLGFAGAGCVPSMFLAVCVQAIYLGVLAWLRDRYLPPQSVRVLGRNFGPLVLVLYHSLQIGGLPAGSRLLRTENYAALLKALLGGGDGGAIIHADQDGISGMEFDRGGGSGKGRHGESCALTIPVRLVPSYTCVRS
jgi:hypothetical protein